MMILDIMVTIGDLFLTMAQIDMLDVSQDDGTGQITKRCKNYDPSRMLHGTGISAIVTSFGMMKF